MKPGPIPGNLKGRGYLRQGIQRARLLCIACYSISQELGKNCFIMYTLYSKKVFKVQEKPFSKMFHLTLSNTLYIQQFTS